MIKHIKLLCSSGLCSHAHLAQYCHTDWEASSVLSKGCDDTARAAEFEAAVLWHALKCRDVQSTKAGSASSVPVSPRQSRIMPSHPRDKCLLPLLRCNSSSSGPSLVTDLVSYRSSKHCYLKLSWQALYSFSVPYYIGLFCAWTLLMTF